MNKEFIPYEQALELKELGFNDKCLVWYHKGKLTFNELYDLPAIEEHPRNASAPLYQEAFRWFREKYNLFSKVDVCSDKYDLVYYDTTMIDVKKLIVCDNQDNGKYNTYEEAELACLKKLIEIVKTK